MREPARATGPIEGHPLIGAPDPMHSTNPLKHGLVDAEYIRHPQRLGEKR